MLRINKNAVGNKKLKIKSKNSKNNNLIIYLIQPVQQLEEKK